MSDKKLSIFSRLTDNKDIVKFVKEIEKHPCLYDQKLIEYSNRDLKRDTWIEIARKTNSTVSDCKMKWTKIRIAYSRTLRPNYRKESTNTKKPYYLAKYLKFLTPGTRNTERCHVPPSTSKNADEIDETDKKDINKVDEQSNSDNLSSSNENQHEVYLDELHYDNNDEIDGFDTIDGANSDLSKVQSGIEYRNTHNSRMEKRQPCCENLECNPRKMFLLSLLPDVQNLTEQQMRSFRRQIITLLDNVLCE